MKERQFSRTLNKIVEEEVPATLDLWPDIRAQVRPQQRAAWGARLKPASGLSWALIALVVSLAFGAVAYAAAPAVLQLFRQAPILDDVVQADLIHELDVSETVEDVTVTLERGYADANRVVIGFTVQGPDAQRLELNRLALTDAAGTALPWIHGYGAAGESDILGLSLPPGEEAHAYVFDASPIAGAPETLDLRLTMDLEELPVPSDAPAPMPSTAGSPDERPESAAMELQPMPEGTTVGSVTFEFNVPMAPGRTVEVDQTVEAAGTALTLERVVITPSETRAMLCFDAPDGGEKEWLLIAPDAHDLSDGARAACHQVVYPARLADRGGRAELTVTELVGFDPLTGDQTRLSGPWVFRFQVP